MLEYGILEHLWMLHHLCHPNRILYMLHWGIYKILLLLFYFLVHLLLQSWWLHVKGLPWQSLMHMIFNCFKLWISWRFLLHESKKKKRKCPFWLMLLAPWQFLWTSALSKWLKWKYWQVFIRSSVWLKWRQEGRRRRKGGRGEKGEEGREEGSRERRQEVNFWF